MRTMLSRFLHAAGVVGSKSNRDKASRNELEASSKYGVPGPILGRVLQTAPAGIKDSRPFNLKPNQPMVVRRRPAPESSTFREYTQPRSKATAEGGTTTNSTARAQMLA